MVQKGTINVLIIRPRHKINIADNSILFSPLNMSEFVSSGTTTWKTALKIIRTKCQACQNWHIQIWHQNWIWNCGLVNKQKPPCSHQARGQTPNTIPLSKNATILRSAPPCMAVNKIYLGFSLPDPKKKAICRCHWWIMKTVMWLSAAALNQTCLYHSSPLAHSALTGRRVTVTHVIVIQLRELLTTNLG